MKIDGFDTAVIYLLSVFVSIFSTIKIILTPDRRTFKKAVTSFFVGFPCGILTGLLAVHEFGAGLYTALVVASLFSLIGENIIMAILENTTNISQYTDKIIRNLIDKFTK